MVHAGFMKDENAGNCWKWNTIPHLVVVVVAHTHTHLYTHTHTHTHTHTTTHPHTVKNDGTFIL